MCFIKTVVSLILILALAFSFAGSAGFSYAAKEPGAALFDEYCICGDCRTCQECITCDTCDACEVCYACQECNTCKDRFLCEDCYICEDCYLCEECYICEDCITCNYCRINEEPCTGDEFCVCEDCYIDHDSASIGEDEDDFVNIDEDDDDFANIGEDEDGFANVGEDEDGFVNIGEDEDGFIGGEAIDMASQPLPIDIASQDLSIALINSSAIEQFVTRLYRQALGREPTQANLKKWTDAFKRGDPAATVAYKVFFGKEFLRRNVSNDSFIEILYRSLLDREPDSAGRKRWRNRMAAGLTREETLARFIKTVEFTNYCKQAGIARGTYKPPPGIAKHTKFVMNMHRGVLGRETKQERLHIWVTRIRDGVTGASVAQSFVFSGEAKRRNRSDEQFVDSLYRGLLGREPDTKSKKKWMNRIKAGWPREDILAGFIKTAEFKNVCKQAGVVRGTYKPPAGGMVRVFVMRMYREALGREPSQADLKTWVDRILAGRTGASVANSFIFGNEMKKRNLTDAEFVDALYKAMLGCKPDLKSRATWISRLQKGTPRYDAFVSIFNSKEFSKVCSDFGIKKGTAPKPPVPLSLSGKVIILDPGHGTAGSPGIAGYNEAIAMLDLARKLKPLLEAQGAKVIMTRDSETNIPISVRCAMINIEALRAVRATRTKSSELAEIDRLIRVMQSIISNPGVNGPALMNLDSFNAARQIHPDLRRVFEITNNSVVRNNFLVISLHSNATGGGSSSVNGADVFFIDPAAHANTRTYYQGYSYTGQSRSFGNILLNHIHTTGIARRSNGLRAENYAMIREVNVPAVLAENGFHTNPSDRALLSSPAYRQNLATAYRNAILEYFR